ncbi:MAG: DUF2752 domain-containing protein [Pirellulaceae bacterium]
MSSSPEVQTEVAKQSSPVVRRLDVGAVVWFGGAVLVLLAAYSFSVVDGRLVELPFVQIALPETCAFRGTFGMDCPGCGLTRSFVHIAHGRLGDAWQLHAVSFILFAYTLAQLPLSLWYAFVPWQRRRENAWYRRLIWINERMLVPIACLLLLRWLWRLWLGSV